MLQAVAMLRKQGIEPVLLKGFSLAALYPNPALRQFGDIDLFVTMPPKFYNYILAAQYLEELLGCSVDLIQDNRNIRPFFRQQIERDGVNIFTAA